MTGATTTGIDSGNRPAAAKLDDRNISTTSEATTVQMSNRRHSRRSSTASLSNPLGRTLLEEMEEAMAQSLLVFLVADLRLMSATGRVETKYETIAIASDPPTRSTAAELAGLETDFHSGKGSAVNNQEEGLSPAQIMAVLMIELNKTVESKRKREQELELLQEAGLSTRSSRSEQVESDGLSSWKVDERTGKLKLRADDDDMTSLLRCYAEMIGGDLKVEPVHIEKRYSTMNLNPRMESVPEEDEEDDLDDVEEGNDDIDVENQPIGKAAGDAVAKVAEDTKQKATETVQQMEKNVQKVKERRRSMMKSKGTKTNEQFEGLTDALFRQGSTSKDLRASLAKSMGRQNRNFTSEELVAYVERAVESRVYGKLDFLASLFKDGSVTKLMAESKARVVWMNDWYPLKDLTYAIAVNPEMKRVLVVFRGAITMNDWSKAVESRNFHEAPNPIDEDYEGKTDTVNMSAGFYEYLFRIRKDTNTKKYDEIANLAYRYGKERIGDDFHLVVTGHSLGGALSTVFSFFASADERFTVNAPVKCFNFGSPYVGGKKFMMAFHHQEQQQLLMYARFFNHNDIVAHLPPNFQMTKEGGKFRPVGVSVRVPKIPTGCGWACRRHWKPDVFYVKNEGFWRSYWRAFRDNVFFKFPLPPWEFARMHKLEEMQERLMYGKLIGGGLNFDLLNKPIEELYDMMVGTSYCK